MFDARILERGEVCCRASWGSLRVGCEFVRYGLEEHSWNVFETTFAPRGKGRALHKQSPGGVLDGFKRGSNKFGIRCGGAERSESTMFVISCADADLARKKLWI